MKNVIVILCDQLRPDYLSCYGCEQIKTPNIDALAQDGVLFERSTTISPVCAPARASMMTGRYVSDHNVWANDMPFRDGMEYIATRMKENGYRCGAFGKLHHYPPKDSKDFDVALLMEESRLTVEDDYYKYIHELHPDIKNLYAMDETGHFKYSLDEYYEHWIANSAMNFIEDSKEQPAFAWVSFQGPHTPLDAPKDNGISSVKSMPIPEHLDFEPPCEVVKYRKSREGYRDNAIENVQKYLEEYAQLIELIDYEVGRIVEYLKKSGQYDNTVIIFSADHGNMCYELGMTHKGPFLYAGQLEIPMIVANHEDLPKGVRSDMLVSNLDIPTTALAVAGDKRPLGYSKDIAEMYNNSELQRDVIFSEFCDTVKIASTKDYRLAYYPFAMECELVKIDNEIVNLADSPEHQSLKAQLLMEIIDFTLMSRPVHVESDDFTPKVQSGLRNKYPNFLEDFEIVFPLGSMRDYEKIKADGLDPDYNAFCIERDEQITRFYGKYWSGMQRFKNTY